MSKFFKFFIFLFCFNFFFNNALKAGSNYANELAYKNHEHVSLELISPVNSIGQENNLNFGLFFKLKPGWKIYWKNPGKAGYPPSIDWVKSKNIEELKILWPKPKKFEILGMESIGYSGNIVLPIDLQIKDNRLTDESIEIIYILAHPEKKGYARQNELIPPNWISIHFGGDVPIIING